MNSRGNLTSAYVCVSTQDGTELPKDVLVQLQKSADEIVAKHKDRLVLSTDIRNE